MAHELRGRAHFCTALRVMEEFYGDAILTTTLSALVKADALQTPPNVETRRRTGRRCGLEMELQVINTHLGPATGKWGQLTRYTDRPAQVEALLEPQ